jgi:hypothetical protein
MTTKIRTYRLQLLQLLTGPDQGFVPCREIFVASGALRFFQQVLWCHASEFCNTVLRKEGTDRRRVNEFDEQRHLVHTRDSPLEYSVWLW